MIAEHEARVKPIPGDRKRIKQCGINGYEPLSASFRILTGKTGRKGYKRNN